MLAYRRFRFFFGKFPYKKRFAFILFRKMPTNLVITLADLRYKVIFSCKAGSIEGDKRFQRSPYVMEPIFAKLLLFFRYYKISFLKIILHMRSNSQVFAFLKKCASKGIRITRILQRYNLPHNGIRARKAPRK